MNNSCRVLHVFGRMDRGGAEMRTVALLRHLRGNGIVQHFCVLSGEEGHLDNEIRSLGGKVNYLKLNSVFIPRFLSLLREEGYDVVHSHVYYVSGLFAMLGALSGVKKRVVHFRSMSDGALQTPGRRARNWLLRAMIDLFATDILAVSEGAMEQAWRANWRKDIRCQVVYNGFDTVLYSSVTNPRAVRARLGIGPNCRLIIHIGRLDAAKNHHQLVRIFAQMCARQPNLHLLLVGKGSNGLEAELRSFFHDKRLEHSVTFAGVREDIPCLLAAADLMIFPSLWEGMPGAVVEARLSGLPVIASDLPGIREIARHLGGMDILSLNSDIQSWVETAFLRLNTHHRSIPDLEGTPFSIHACASEIQRIWLGRES